jgi:hypothetical protein
MATVRVWFIVNEQLYSSVWMDKININCLVHLDRAEIASACIVKIRNFH